MLVARINDTDTASHSLLLLKCPHKVVGPPAVNCALALFPLLDHTVRSEENALPRPTPPLGGLLSRAPHPPGRSATRFRAVSAAPSSLPAPAAHRARGSSAPMLNLFAVLQHPTLCADFSYNCSLKLQIFHVNATRMCSILRGGRVVHFQSNNNTVGRRGVGHEHVTLREAGGRQ